MREETYHTSPIRGIEAVPAKNGITEWSLWESLTMSCPIFVTRALCGVESQLHGKGVCSEL